MAIRSGAEFDESALARNLAELYKLSDRQRFDGRVTLQADRHALQNVVQQIRTAIEGDLSHYKGASLNPFLETLTTLL